MESVLRSRWGDADGRMALAPETRMRTNGKGGCLVRRRQVRGMESKHSRRSLSTVRSPFARQLWHLAINLHPSPSFLHHTSSHHTSINLPPHHLETKLLATPSACGRPFPHSDSFLPPKPQPRLLHAATSLDLFNSLHLQLSWSNGRVRAAGKVSL